MRYSLSLAVIAISLSACQPPAEQEFDPQPWVDQGTAAAATTFSVMTARLQGAIAEGGVPSALSLCNVQAHPLADSLSQALNAEIRRTTLKPRNPENSPSEREREVLLAFQAAFDAGDIPSPMAVQGQNGEVYFHAPIITQAVCTNCHGIPGQTLTEENLAMIQELYPEDQATGYSPDELRGMWSITFRTEEDAP